MHLVSRLKPDWRRSGLCLNSHDGCAHFGENTQWNFKAGYQTPAMAYGANLILEIPTTNRTDIN